MLPGSLPFLHGGCAAACLLWGGLALWAGRGRIPLLHSLACLGAAVWAAAIAFLGDPGLAFAVVAAELLRDASWLLLLTYLARRFVGLRRGAALGYAAVAAAAAMAVMLGFLPGFDAAASVSLLGRLALTLVVVVLAENLYRNAEEAAVWHVVLPCIALGGLSAFDVLLYADAALLRRASPALLNARAVLTALVLPLLVLSALRHRRWRRDPPVSREAVFHGATLLVGGAFLVGVGMVGEALGQLGFEWGPAAQAGIFAAALVAVAVALTSGTARSRVRRLLVDPLFSARYDYRKEWMRCIAMLSGAGSTLPPPVRAIRAAADTVDSPGGVLLLREPDGLAWSWASSWNMPSVPVRIPPAHPLLPLLRGGDWVAAFGATGPEPLPPDLAEAFGPLWLAMPLVHHREGLVGAVLLAPPRAGFVLDREVFDLLRAFGRELALFLLERQSAEQLADARGLRDYAQRFAFVAHDVKTVANQLELVLANAQANIADPEFQQDMLVTVRAAADRINSLLSRLREPSAEPGAAGAAPRAAPAFLPADRLRLLASRRPHRVELEAGAATAGVAIDPEKFDSVVVHLLDNAAEASTPGTPVRIHLRETADGVEVHIIDRGHGMTQDFIRDRLFRPLDTSKPGGTGIGAWQARELLRQAGGDLAVDSQPGAGTTMRIVLPAIRGEGDTRPLALEFQK